MTPEKVLHDAINYSIQVAKWVEDVYKWKLARSAAKDDGPGGGTNPPPPPPPPPPNP